MMPVVLYGYLAYDHFHVDDMRAAYTFDAPYTGEDVYQANGDDLTAWDWYEEILKNPQYIKIKKAVFKLHDG